jgi:hypothetical protein
MFLFLVIINLQIVYANSESFQLPPFNPITRNVEVHENERLVGSFSVSNLQTWQNGWGDTQSYSVSVTIFDPKGQTVLSYTNTKGDSFDYTAFYSGVYTIRFSSGFEYIPPSGIQNPQININYNVISNSQTEPTQSPTGDTPNQSILLPIVILFSVIVSVIIILVYSLAKNSK